MSARRQVELGRVVVGPGLDEAAVAVYPVHRTLVSNGSAVTKVFTLTALQIGRYGGFVAALFSRSSRTSFVGCVQFSYLTCPKSGCQSEPFFPLLHLKLK